MVIGAAVQGASASASAVTRAGSGRGSLLYLSDRHAARQPAGPAARCPEIDQLRPLSPSRPVGSIHHHHRLNGGPTRPSKSFSVMVCPVRGTGQGCGGMIDRSGSWRYATGSPGGGSCTMARRTSSPPITVVLWPSPETSSIRQIAPAPNYADLAVAGLDPQAAERQKATCRRGRGAARRPSPREGPGREARSQAPRRRPASAGAGGREGPGSSGTPVGEMRDAARASRSGAGTAWRRGAGSSSMATPFFQGVAHASGRRRKPILPSACPNGRDAAWRP